MDCHMIYILEAMRSEKPLRREKVPLKVVNYPYIYVSQRLSNIFTDCHMIYILEATRSENKPL